MDSGNLVYNKAQLRLRMKELLASLSPREFQVLGHDAAGLLTSDPSWSSVDTVLAYLAMEHEASCDEVINLALREAKEVYVPLVQGEMLRFYGISGLEGPWNTGSFGIREPYPDKGRLLDTAGIHGRMLVLVPGLAFDPQGGRLGRGKGYYDRFLTSLSGAVFTVGICMARQKVAQVPMGPGDVFMDALVSETDFSVFKNPNWRR